MTLATTRVSPRLNSESRSNSLRLAHLNDGLRRVQQIESYQASTELFSTTRRLVTREIQPLALLNYDKYLRDLDRALIESFALHLQSDGLAQSLISAALGRCVKAVYAQRAAGRTEELSSIVRSLADGSVQIRFGE